MSQDPSATRCGTVVLAGRPNAGKSSLLNALVGERLAITSPKPQTTRLPVTGVRTEHDTQIVFIDPPGLLEPEYALHESMLAVAESALRSADAVLYLHPITEGPPPPFTDVLGNLSAPPRPLITVLSKADLVPKRPRSGRGIRDARGIGRNRRGARCAAILVSKGATDRSFSLRPGLHEYSTGPVLRDRVSARGSFRPSR